MLLSVDDVAKKLEISTQYTRRLMKSGRISALREGNSWFTTQDDLNKFIKKERFVVNPSDRRRKNKNLPHVISLSFFTGAMGLDIGMSREGFSPLLASEINKEARATILANNEDIGLIGDIWSYSGDEIKRFAGIPENRKIDVIFGGPPCQAFSTAGKRKGFEDSRGNVFIKYIEIIGELKPTYAIIENVRGLQTTPAILDDTNGEPVKGGALYYAMSKLKSFGYSVSFNLYNAANFGAPQKRERFVIIAKLGKKKVPYLTPTNSENGDYGLPKWRTLGSAIGDIQDKTMHYAKLPDKRKKWLKKIPEGGNWKSLSIDEQKEAMGKKFYMGGGKTGFLRRLSYSEPSPTLVTVPTMPATDLVHPTKMRPLSIEEYSRIQGFPDDWLFCGSITEVYKQIGNAVPIKLGEAIGKAIKNDMENKHDRIYKGFRYSKYKNTSEVDFPQLYKRNREKVLNKQGQLTLDI
ncbi:DNA cytosine methyltransferase [Companilactobacillus suantsaicola]|uniref:Cytosine-specific methyltransferase n=1 Tax=Companilactobacillus suantsaicola TaxID=2487723 RepID=A0A4Z0JGS0_9LACO|nr:DNA cytosine methyltransferase [Companilactobacillus suantsaicola]TGD21956.1 DNA cytosine methyltransferase [Companilactobacillus suantsaicola]